MNKPQVKNPQPTSNPQGTTRLFSGYSGFAVNPAAIASTSASRTASTAGKRLLIGGGNRA